MKIYVYLDESGSIHKNSKTKYFAVGGYFTFKEDKTKITSLYKKLNKEIKSYDMTDEEKINVFNNIQDINTFYGCAKIFEKPSMKKRNNRIKYLLQLCSKVTI